MQSFYLDRLITHCDCFDRSPSRRGLPYQHMLLVFCLLLLSGLSMAQVTPIAQAHRQITTIDQQPDWVRPLPVVQQDLTVSAQVAETPAQGFHFALLNLQHKVLDRGVDYFVHVQKKITAVSGLSQANLEIEFDPEHETILWQVLQLRRGDELIDVRARTEARVIDREKSLEAAILFGRKTLFLIVPDVRVGDIVEYSYVLQERNPLWQTHFFLTRYLEWPHPVERYFLQVQWPQARAIHWSVPDEFSDLQPVKRGSDWVFQYDSAALKTPTAFNEAGDHFLQTFTDDNTSAQGTVKKYFSQAPTQYKHMSYTRQPEKGEGHAWFSSTQLPGESAPIIESNITQSVITEQAPALTKAGVLPMVEFSEFGDWAELAQWVQQIWAQSGRHHETEQVYALWQSLSQAQHQSPHADPEARLLEVIHWVQDQVRYFGLELGMGSLKPRSPDAVLHSRFGDCKDKTLLLITLLKAIGLEASPVLVHTEQARLPYTLPTPAAFNHVIVEVPWQGMRLWIDATRSWQGGRLQQMHVADYAKGLVLAEGQNGQWQERPVIALRNETEVHTRVTVGQQAAQTNAMQVTTQYFGQSADAMRAQLQRHGQVRLAQGRLARYRTYYEGLAISEPLQLDDDRVENTLAITEHYDIPNVWQIEQAASSRFYADALYPLLRALTAQLELGEAMVPPQRVRHQLEIVLPHDGWRIPETRTEFANAHFAFNYHSSLRGRHVLVGYELKPRQPTLESFQRDLATIAQDLGRIENVLVFELNKEGASTLVAQGNPTVGKTAQLAPFLALALDRVQTAGAQLKHQALLRFSRWQGALSSSIAGFSIELPLKNIDTRNELKLVLRDYTRALTQNVVAQVALLIALSLWLAVRLLRRRARAKQSDGLYHPSAGVFAILSLVTLGCYAVVWLIKNYGHKRGRARLRYWAGERLGCFPVGNGLRAVSILGVILLAIFYFSVYWPLLLTGVAFFSFCPRVRDLYRAGTGAGLGVGLGPDLALQPQSTARDHGSAKMPHEGSVAA